ncbi:MAG TPA: GNAT family N-acetyltransferase [Chthoniobacteraceae bacterium]|nr:GNAT family N-acetyltransferase [Chthoniobacteraceae bacterium]
MNLPVFRPLRREELDTVLGWAQAEGWNPGLRDADAFWSADPDGFHAMEYEGELIGSASTVVYAGRLGFVGLFIVRPEWRGRGLGSAFWNGFIDRMRERLGAGGGAALDGVFTMQPYYAKSGFRFSHRNLRMEGVGEEHPGAPDDPHLIEAGSLDFETVLDFDRRHFGAERRDFLRRWIAPDNGVALAWKEGALLRGYGVLRPCSRGFKIGPLFADTPEVAEALYTGLSRRAAGESLFLDIPENNPDAVALAARHGLREGFGCARMTLGAFPELPWGRIYGVTTFELG